MKYAIYDWTGVELIAYGYFESFDDAWDYILGDLTDRLGLTEEDYGEYQVLEHDSRDTRYLDPNDVRKGKVKA